MSFFGLRAFARAVWGRSLFNCEFPVFLVLSIRRRFSAKSTTVSIEQPALLYLWSVFHYSVILLCFATPAAHRSLSLAKLERVLGFVLSIFKDIACVIRASATLVALTSIRLLLVLWLRRPEVILRQELPAYGLCENTRIGTMLLLSAIQEEPV